MKQSICSTQVYECTEIGHVLNNSPNHIAYMDALKQLLLHLCLLSNNQLLAVADNSSSLRIELCDYELNLLSCILLQVLLWYVSDTRLAGMKIRDSSTITLKPPSVPVQPGCQHFFILKRFFQTLACPSRLPDACRSAQPVLAVVYLQDFYFHRVANGNKLGKISTGICSLYSLRVRIPSDL